MIALWVAITAAPMASRADETYILCGPKSVGFIQAKGQTACIGGSLDWRPREQQRRAANSAKKKIYADHEAMMAVARKIAQRIEGLVFSDCGERPLTKSYDIRYKGDPQNKLGSTAYQRAEDDWNRCSERVMKTKYRKEKQEMDKEMMMALPGRPR